MQRREGRERGYLGIDDSAAGARGSAASATEDVFDLAASVNQGFTDEQIDKLKENTELVTQREEEITNIVKVRAKLRHQDFLRHCVAPPLAVCCV